MASYPDKKNLIKDETNNLLEKLTEEHSIGPTYSCLQIGAYCFAQVAALYEVKGKKIPKELIKFIEQTYPKLMDENQQLMEEQHLMLNTDGSA
jgi:hypothetical protein